jgi:site-specific DNA recombinase
MNLMLGTLADKGLPASRCARLRAARYRDRFDILVTGALVEKLFNRDQVWDFLPALAVRRAERAAAVDTWLASLEREADTAGEKLKRLHKLIEDGVTEAMTCSRIELPFSKVIAIGLRHALNRPRCGVRAIADVSLEAVVKFGVLIQRRVREGETPARKAWIGAIIDWIEADQGTIRIMGRKDVLEHVVANGGHITPGVRTCIPKWRTRQDSNL